MPDSPSEREIEEVAAEARGIAAYVANAAKFHRLETLIDQLEDAALDRVRDARGDEGRVALNQDRVGSVAVEDVATWLEGRASFYPAKGFAVDGAIAMAFRSAARDFVTEFSGGRPVQPRAK